MSKVPLIILGAGASYDSVPDEDVLPHNRPWKPPLTNNVLHPTIYSELFDELPEVKNLVAGARNNVNPQVTLEQYIREVRNSASTKIERQKQLISFRFYLQKLFQIISNRYDNPASNHRELVNQIIENGGRACVVNFNYDTLFERAAGISMDSRIDSYVTGDIKVIKPHGSHNWAYVLTGDFSPDNTEINEIGAYKFLMQQPWYLTQRNPFGDVRSVPLFYQLIPDMSKYAYEESGGRKLHLHPAIAIPVDDKNEFVAPQTHIKIMEQDISNADRILVIGWKAGDEKLLEIMKEKITAPVHLVVVSNDPESAKIIGNKISGYIPTVNREFVGGGYTQYVRTGRLKKFLSEELNKK